MHTITIRPIERGWMVEHDEVDNPMIFRSGAVAERTARRLAVRLSDAGQATDVVVYLRDGTLGARFSSDTRIDGGVRERRGAVEARPTPRKRRTNP